VLGLNISVGEVVRRIVGKPVLATVKMNILEATMARMQVMKLQYALHNNSVQKRV